LIDFINSIIFRVVNLFTTLGSDIKDINSDNIVNMVINGGMVFAFFFFISRWFRAYILRLVIFLFGAWVLWSVSARSTILYSFDFYGGLGMIIPQLEIVEITYLLLKERTLFIYNQLIGLLQYIISPFVWLYYSFKKLVEYIKAKELNRRNSKKEKEYYSEEFRARQREEWKKEQARADQKAQREFREQEAKRKQKEEDRKREYKNSYSEDKKSKSRDSYSRWDSTDPYEVLGVSNTATQSEIKKAYRRSGRAHV